MRQTCPDCLRPISHCYCDSITMVNNHWPVIILQHKQEENHAIGTARIAALSLTNCRLYRQSEQVFTPGLINEKNALLVYPGEQAIPLEDFVTKELHPLVFIDASWRKSRRMLHEFPFLASLPRVSFAPPQASRYTLRKAPRENYLSTVEAIVHVLSLLEKDQRKYKPLLQTMDSLIQSQIDSMGMAVFRRNYQKKAD